MYDKLNEEFLKKIERKYDYDYNYNNHYDDIIWKKVEKQSKNTNITIKDVLNKFTPEKLIDAIGEKNVEKILRKRKINKIKKTSNE